MLIVSCPAHGERSDCRTQAWARGGRTLSQCPACLEAQWRGGAKAPWLPAREVKWTDKGERATKCGPRCRDAKRPPCDCECRGMNHGAGMTNPPRRRNPPKPIAYDPATNRYSGAVLVRGDVLRLPRSGSPRGVPAGLYSVERANGFMLNVDRLKDFGHGYLERSSEGRSFSVDPGVTSGPWAFTRLYPTGVNLFDTPNAQELRCGGGQGALNLRSNPLLMTVGANPRRRRENGAQDVYRRITDPAWPTRVRRWYNDSDQAGREDILTTYGGIAAANVERLARFGFDHLGRDLQNEIKRNMAEHGEPPRPTRSNPTLMLVAANPPAGAIERVKRAWARFHHHAFNGKVRQLAPIPGGPSAVFALGHCDSMDFGTGDAKCKGTRPLLCYDPTDQSLWIVATGLAMNLSACKGRALKAITYDPIAASGKEDALFRHDFDTPRPTLEPVGNARRCRAAILQGGVYVVTDWIRN